MSGPGAHSRLGASAAYRWLNCPGSVALLSTLPPAPDSPYSIEGKDAHALAEYCLKNGETSALDYVELGVEGQTNVTSEDMARAVGVYLAEVWEAYGSDVDGKGELYVETRADLSSVDPELWGTNDALVYLPSSRELYVFDYKHGQGVTVEATDNPQLKFYAYGGWLRLCDKPIDKIIMVIVQPRGRGEPVKLFEMTPADLYDFSIDLEEGVRAVHQPNAPRVPGPWCDKTFCAARAVCPELRAKAMAAAGDGFAPVDGKPLKLADPTTFHGDELGQRLREAKHLQTYLKALFEHANAEAFAGRAPTGWKLVAGQGRRAWNPLKAESEIAAAIAKLGNHVEPWEKSLISPAEAEKALGKKLFESISKEFVRKKPGSPTLVPVEDKRPVWSGDSGDGFENANT